MCGTRPHHSWMTTTPGPPPSAGAKYPAPVEPLLGNSTMLPMRRTISGQTPGVTTSRWRIPALLGGVHGAGVAAVWLVTAASASTARTEFAALPPDSEP